MAIPFGVLGYASVYIPQTHFPLGIYLAAMVAAALCTVQMIVCDHAFTFVMILPGLAFIWAMIAPNVRFLPVSLTLGIIVLAFAFAVEREVEFLWHQDRTKETRGEWKAHTDYGEDDSDSTLEDSDEYEMRKESEQMLYRRKPANDDIELKLEDF